MTFFCYRSLQALGEITSLALRGEGHMVCYLYFSSELGNRLLNVDLYRYRSITYLQSQLW